nr:unnamed protein product [Spirometra erinaceieuropaei]
MSTVDELRRAVYRYLEETGGLRKLEAQTEAEVFSALNNMASNGERKPSDPIHSENFLVNELILEYFKFNDLKFSEKTFRKEAEHLSQPISRRILCQTLNAHAIAECPGPLSADETGVMGVRRTFKHWFTGLTAKD